MAHDTYLSIFLLTTLTIGSLNGLYLIQGPDTTPDFDVKSYSLTVDVKTLTDTVDIDAEISLDVLKSALKQVAFKYDSLKGFSLVKITDKSEKEVKGSIVDKDNTITVTLDGSAAFDVGVYVIHLNYSGTIGKDGASTLMTYDGNTSDQSKKVFVFKAGEKSGQKIVPRLEADDRAAIKLTVKHPATHWVFSVLPLVYNKTSGTSSFAKATNQMSIDWFSMAITNVAPSGGTNYNVILRDDLSKGIVEANRDVVKSLMAKAKLPEGSVLTFLAVKNYGVGFSNSLGLITFDEQSFVHDASTQTIDHLQSTIRAIAKSISQQNYGGVADLKDEEKWIFGALNEYSSYMLASQSLPQWKFDNSFLVDDKLTAMEFDSTKVTYPLATSATQEKDQTSQKLISEKKGASIMFMLSKAIGDDVFNAGLDAFTKKGSTQLVTLDDFFTSLQTAVNSAKTSNAALKDFAVKDFVSGWTNQKGYPLITAKKSFQACTITLTQQRFQSDAKESTTEKWPIPIAYIDSSKPEYSDSKASKWLNAKDENLVIALEKIAGTCSPFALFNKLDTGYYRTTYDLMTRTSIKKFMSTNANTLPPAIYANFLDDLLTLARVPDQKVTYKDALTSLDPLKIQTDLLLWSSVARHLDYLDKHMENDEAYSSYQTYIAPLYQAVFKSVDKWNESPDVNNPTRTLTERLVVPRLCKTNDTTCVTKVIALYDAMLTTPVLPDWQEVVYCESVRSHAKAKDNWKALRERYAAIQDEEEQARILLGLACYNDMRIIDRYLLLTLEDGVKKEHKPVVLRGVARNGDVHLRSALTFLNGNFDAARKAIDNDQALADVITEMSTFVVTVPAQTLFNNVIAKATPLLDATKIAAITANVDANLAWSNARKKELVDFVKSVDPALTTTVAPLTDAPTTASTTTTTTEAPASGGTSAWTIIFAFISLAVLAMILYFLYRMW